MDTSDGWGYTVGNVVTVIAREVTATEALVFAWPYPIGAECEVSCGPAEVAVMCPAWTVTQVLGPGYHQWRTPDPMRPTVAYFVSNDVHRVAFDAFTFLEPHRRARVYGTASFRCVEPSLLMAQFVGLPFYDHDRAIKQGVARSLERMAMRLLWRMQAQDAPNLAARLLAELPYYNPLGGAVFGLALVRLEDVQVRIDNGERPLEALPHSRPATIRTPPPGSVTIRTEPGVDLQRKTDQHPVVVALGRTQTEPLGGVVITTDDLPTDSFPAVDYVPPPEQIPPPGSASKSARDRIASDSDSAVMAIGTTAIGIGVGSESDCLFAPGTAVLAPGRDGRLVQATIRQHHNGMYEIYLATTNELVWVAAEHIVLP